MLYEVITVDHPSLTTDRSVFHTVREEGSVLLYHPYQSDASSVERFLLEASLGPGEDRPHVRRADASYNFV